MEDRIRKILKEKNLSASKLADEIGVQRSSISHIISGRNKPSLDFVRKVLLKYPELNADWLVTGKGQMMDDVFSSEEERKDKDLFGLMNEEDETAKQKTTKNPPEAENQLKKIRQVNREFSPEKRLITVVLLYDDGSFSDYVPENQ
ncbi:MAG: helix-turn-helix domain-containing protein [Bacteroidales bacterium]|nr:helix-turn-helix domain-containing protein [Bacteroidales bacterium]MCF8343768.1 helix-turn-helix domain-containing protein [Bacteroidales bacterium]MCF8351633.1 helix-turn-helix domain-containing protein [Bacteroidales bacterium]MCF8375239.1 helix-turn-helix domain-containing protein [Bacteroidales bacterium]MCF8400263.1 helix-turn-helix domain-containing protein [Bacteroidales bacterium]